MSDPTSAHKPYTTGAMPDTAALKDNVEMTDSGWVRKITATNFKWAGNDDTSSDPEIYVAFRGAMSIVGWFAYMYYAPGNTYTAATPAALSFQLHFNEAVDVTGTPQYTITNDKTVGPGATVTTYVASYASGTGTNILTFTGGVPAAGGFLAGNIIRGAANALSLNSGTIKDAGTSVVTSINTSTDVGYMGTPNSGGNRSIANVYELEGPRRAFAA
jgi:hypothetical protein|tara:strand:+ start:1318 stop:1965 length:648 start_codon:yes stop_codon:yes gene_type:complete